jgi:hypothetical protein
MDNGRKRRAPNRLFAWTIAALLAAGATPALAQCSGSMGGGGGGIRGTGGGGMAGGGGSTGVDLGTSMAFIQAAQQAQQAQAVQQLQIVQFQLALEHQAAAQQQARWDRFKQLKRTENAVKAIRERRQIRGGHAPAVASNSEPSTRTILVLSPRGKTASASSDTRDG